MLLKDPVRIQVVVLLSLRADVRSIQSRTVSDTNRHDVMMNQDNGYKAVDGERYQGYILMHIPYANLVWQKGLNMQPTLLTTRYHIKVITICFGMNLTGRQWQEGVIQLRPIKKMEVMAMKRMSGNDHAYRGAEYLDSKSPYNQVGPSIHTILSVRFAKFGVIS